MHKSLFYIILLIFSSVCALAQPDQFNELYSVIRKSYDEQRAYQTVAFVEQRWRLAGNTGFNESIKYVENILKEAGFQKEINGEADGDLTYRIEKRPMRKPTWEPVNASVILDRENLPLLEFTTNRNMIAINSASTKETGETAEVIYLGEGQKEDWDDKDVKGKIVFVETHPASVYRLAMSRGALGVFAYSVPAYNQPQVHQTSISFQSIPYQDSLSQRWAVLLSYSAKEKLKNALTKGKVNATVQIKTKIYQAEELTLVANIRGNKLPEERFVFSAHVQEPGANDNASGVGTLAEMARTAATLVRNQKLNPERTITFLWGDEIVSTRRYIQDDASRAKGIKWGLSLDMVGEDVTKTGGTFLIEKMPDPSAIWTRGDEKHSEWGGRPLEEKDLFPHYFNNFILNRCLQQASSNNWLVKTNPFEGGSDHTPFLDAKIPGLLMWHFTDVFYHVDGDRLVNVSAQEMKNVGVSALASALILSSANEKTTSSLIEELKRNALDRLQVEFELSKKAIVSGENISEEEHILDVWNDYYKKALQRMDEISITGKSKSLANSIEDAQSKIEMRCNELKKKLTN